MKIAVGTVQFGLSYGVANHAGQTPQAAAAEILARARAAGATYLDTAIGYGEAESVLGRIGAARDGWQIISKLPALPRDIAARDVEGWCRDALFASLDRLRADALSGLLLHRPDDLLGTNGAALADALHALRKDGLTGAVGISIYGPDDLDALHADPSRLPVLPLDIVQCPASALDRRLETSGWADRLQAAGTRIHLRSAFLQGLLLLPQSDLPDHLAHAADDLRRWHGWLAETGSSPLAAALRFAMSRGYAECAVLGMDSVDHLTQILEAARQDGPIPPAGVASRNPVLLDPRKWMKQ